MTVRVRTKMSLLGFECFSFDFNLLNYCGTRSLINLMLVFFLVIHIKVNV